MFKIFKNFIYNKISIVHNFNNLKKFNLKNFEVIDYFITSIYSVWFSLNSFFFINSRVNFRFFKSVSKNNFNFFVNGFVSFWYAIRYWSISIILFLLSFYYLLCLHVVALNKISFIWFCVIMSFYWLISGFVFFIKKYQYSKYTSAIQRFWRRSYIIFWGLESFLFCIFFYLVLNASQEPSFTYDLIQLQKSHLFSWKFFLIKLLPSSVIIILCYLLIFNIKWNIFTKINNYILIITILLTYIVWLEFYQFFFTVTWYGDLMWLFDIDEKLWNIEVAFKRTRLVNSYITICIIAKFWHLIFIYLFWIFFILRCGELSRVRYPLISANLQNFIILYIMNYLLMYPWLKFLVKRYYSIMYYWFYVSPRKFYGRGFWFDLYLCYTNILSVPTFFKNFKFYNFFYWVENAKSSKFFFYRKFYIKDFITNVINLY